MMRLTTAAVCSRQRGEIDDATGTIRKRRLARHLVAVSAVGQLRGVEVGGVGELVNSRRSPTRRMLVQLPVFSIAPG